jgi:hypothetical protein
MARRTPATEPAASPAVHVIHEHAVYSADSFRRAFGLRTSSLRRELREGRLKVYKRCGKYFILGEDILAWLRGGAVRPGGHAAPEANGEQTSP